MSLSWKKGKSAGATAGSSAGIPLQPFSCPENWPGCHLLLALRLHRGKTLMTKSISSPSVPHGGLSLTWILCVVMQNHLQDSHWLLIAALTFHPVLGLWCNWSIRGERIVLNITLAEIMWIFIAHLSSLNLKRLQVLITVSTCFYHCCFSSQSNGPRSLFLIFGQYRSEHKVVQTRWEVCLSKVISSLPSCPALAHQICCNYVFTLDLAFFWFKLQSLWGRSHMAPSKKDFNPSACRC